MAACARGEWTGAVAAQSACPGDVPAAGPHASRRMMSARKAVPLTSVPKTIVNESADILGAVPESQFVEIVVGSPTPDAG